MENKELKFVNKSPNPNPTYANVGDSGFDLRAWVTEKDNEALMVDEKLCLQLLPFEWRLIHTGLYFDIPDNCEIQVRPRSGLALKHGITVLNTPGTVDKNYTNELCVILVNLSKYVFVIADGDRIAQAVLMPVYNSEHVTLNQVDEIESNEYRGKNGFGSSGVK